MKQALIKRCSFILFALMSIVTYAQNGSSQIKITGTVTDNSGLLLPGVNVTEKSSKNTVTTDYSGRYEIIVKPGATLVFSFIGMKKTEIPLNGRTNLDAKLQEDSNVLDDIVVVAYGTQKKNNITGAIATIDMEKIQDLPVSNLSEALRGQVPGVSINGGSGRPGTAADIQIRQTFSLSKDGGSDLPLIVIDDMVQIDPTTGRSTLETFNRLDPSEIESMTVLKDGSAAIYGSRASQGAIIVKTKRGKAGVTKFNYISQFAVNDAVSHSKTMNSYQYGLWANRFMIADNRAGTNNSSLFSADELEQMKSLNYDWLDKAWKPAIQQKHALTVSGGNDKATYFAGANYFTQGANLGEQKYDKWNFRTGMTAKVSKNLDFSASVSALTGHTQKSYSKASANINDSSYGSKANGGGEQQDYGYLVHMPKYIPWQTTVNGQEYWMSPFPRTDRNLGSANANTTIAGWNYFATLDNGSKSVNDDFGYNVNMSLNYKVPFIKGLSFKGTFARSENIDKTEQIQLPYVMARIKNYETQDNHLASGATDSDYSIDTNVRNSRVYYDTAFNKSTQTNFFANYDRTFGNHEISAMAGVEKSEAEYSSTRLAYEETTADYAGTYLTAGKLSTSNSTALRGESGTLSYLGRLNYSYKSKYLFQFVFRTDASTKFAPENYYGFFPSVQAGWVVSKEDWFRDLLPGVNNLKLRYSIGKTGKDNILPWRWATYYDIIADKGYVFGTTAGGTLGSGINTRVSPNRNVGWDATVKNNFGIDLAFLRNRLQITTDLYYDRSTEMLTAAASTVGVPISVGGGFAEENLATINAWGSEFSINWNDKIKENVKYNIGLNFGFSSAKQGAYYDVPYALPSTNQRREDTSLVYPQWGFQTWKQTSTHDGILRTDEDIQSYWSYLTERATAAGGTPNYNGITDVSGMRKGMLAYKDLGGVFDSTTGVQKGPDGRIMTGEDFTKLVNKNKTYGFTTNLGMSYKSFFMKTQIATSWGGYRSIDVVKQGVGSTHNMWAHESYWSDMYGDDNTDGKYPNLAYYDSSMLGSASDFWQLNTFRCTVRNLTLGFQLPKEILSELKISNASIGVTGNNLWDLYNPYPNHYRNMYDTSYEAYPTLRTWSVNLNITF
ncbi:SusC/RagA family TonB-linked outer membrane protein [Flavobacterium sp. LM4]|uniref:SusC/RagA family TonB-linked outer membrane protein n=1 Tax=Flavobacterium sp. LM4 TaxID=1938609 RepID=UPI000993D0B6|nr:SusC/RagA family TonB-linked outer membrane protein [Flavobacterium sp. LM4]OOV18185.1 SusC/RagA family TonB-linked outer membrane protein [Flavobacterium sp. LM4]